MTKTEKTAGMLAAMLALLVSCARHYEAQDVELQNESDSVSYMIGLGTGAAVNAYKMRDDSLKRQAQAFLNALERTCEAMRDVESPEAYMRGQYVAVAAKEMVEKGLNGDSTLKLDEDMLLQGIVNGLRRFDGVVSAEDADDVARRVMERMRQTMRRESLTDPVADDGQRAD